MELRIHGIAQCVFAMIELIISEEAIKFFAQSSFEQGCILPGREVEPNAM